MSFSKAALPSDWHMPAAVERIFRFHQCHSCGHRLPDFPFRNLFGPWDPEELALAVQGKVNMVTCETCDAHCSFQAAILIHSPEHQRQLFVAGNSMTIPELNRLRTQIDVLMRAELARHGVLSDLPTQDVRTIERLEEALQIPPESMANEQRAARWRRERLRLGPKKRVQALLEQFGQDADQAFLRHEQGIEKHEGDINLTVDIAYYATYYEQSKAGWETLRSGLLAFTPSGEEQRDLRPLCTNFVENFGENARLRIEEDPRAQHDLSDAYFEALDGLPDLSSVTLDDMDAYRELRGKWLYLTRLASVSRNPAFALDLAEYWVRHIDLDRVTRMDVEILLCFGALLLRVQNRRDEEALPYVHMAAQLFDDTRTSLDGHGKMLRAAAHEQAGRARVERGDLCEALDHFLTAIPLWREIERPDGVQTGISMAYSVAETLQDSEVIAALMAMPEFDDAMGAGHLPREIQLGRVSQDRAQETGTPQITRATIVLVENLDGVKLGRAGIVIRPLNYDPNAGEPPIDAVVEVESQIPYEEVAWRRLCADNSSFAAPIVVIRRAQASGDILTVVEEHIQRHPFLDWIDEMRGTPHFPARQEIGTNLLWKWAAEHDCQQWLTQEHERVVLEHGESVGAWPAAVRIGFSAACEQVALHRPGLPDLVREKFARWGIEMLADLLGPTKFFSVPMRISPLESFRNRSRLGRLLEFTGQIGLAKLTYENNLWQGFRIRQADETKEHREAIQDLIGAEAERLNRSRLRQVGRPDPALCEKIFDTIEMVRARLLTDRLEEASGEKAPMLIDAASAPAIHYTQLSLLQGVGEYLGCWVAATASGDQPIQLNQLSWHEPYRLSNALQRVFQGRTEAPDPENDDLSLDTPMICMSALARWVASAQLLNTNPEAAPNGEALNLVSPSLYLHGYPWSFLGAAWPELMGGTDRCPPVAAAFSRKSALLAHLAPKADAAPITIFLDPLGDLPQLTALDSNWAARATVHRGLRATAAGFRQAVTQASVLAFVGHGLHGADDTTPRLLFSLGQALTAETLAQTPGTPSGTVRVAVILSCWAGRTQASEQVGAWEPAGLVYALKQNGFTHVISALWPITPRAAALFLDPFLEGLTAGIRVEHAFAEAYRQVIDTLGLELAVVEGGCIQLFV